VEIAKAPAGSSVIDVLDRVLDKGIVIAACVRVSFAGIDVMTVSMRITVASIDSHLEHVDSSSSLASSRFHFPASLVEEGHSRVGD
jgi:gas vesicle structural protein